MLQRRRILAALTLLVSSYACTGLGAVSSHRGATWSEARSAHFVLRTDLSRERAVETVQLLEQLLQAYLRAGWNAQGWPEPLLIVAFRTGADVQHFQPKLDGFYRSNSVLPTLAVAAWHEGPEGLATIKHELTHHIAFQIMPRQPPWFAEGIATFYESARFYKGRFELGAFPELGWSEAMPAEQLLADDADHYDPRFYPTAWLLVHYLMMRRPRDLYEYERDLAKGKSFQEAWSTWFANIDLDHLTDTLESYLRDGANRALFYDIDRDAAVVQVRALEDADVYSLRARLYFECRPGDDWLQQGQANVELALQARPGDLDASLLQLVYLTPDRAQTLRLAKRVTTEHPDSWAAWLLLASLEEDDSEAVNRLIALRPTHPRAVMLVAMRAMREGRAADALQLSQRALRSSPSDSWLINHRAYLLARSGDRAAACELGSQALRTSSDDARSVAERIIARYCAHERAPPTPVMTPR
jgi:hypothetical protein